MKLVHWRDEASNSQIVRIEIPDRDLEAVYLDGFDRAVLTTPREGIADVLQDLQILAFRLEQESSE